MSKRQDGTCTSAQSPNPVSEGYIVRAHRYDPYVEKIHGACPFRVIKRPANHVADAAGSPQ
jgi:hypothetical protein